MNMRQRIIPRILITGLVGAGLCVALLAQPAASESPSDVVATVGAAKVSLGQVDELAMQLTADGFGTMKLRQAIYAARRRALDEIVANMLLDEDVKLQHVDRSALMEREVTSKVSLPTDAEVTSWYLANQERVQGATLEQARAAIRDYIVQERTQSAQLAYIGRLKTKTSVKVLLKQPREVVAATGAALGPDTAPVEVVEFSDFECPYCRRAAPIVKQLVAAYGSRVRLVYRHYPLTQHVNARSAAEAALCANEQGQFWPYHDRLFADPSKVSEADLKQTAKDLKLDSGRFNTCFDSHTFKGTVDTDLKAGLAAGVSGTPAFFVNGRPLFGVPSLEEFKRVIDEELETKAAK
jgi:protein-disulfide isomerase